MWICHFFLLGKLVGNYFCSRNILCASSPSLKTRTVSCWINRGVRRCQDRAGKKNNGSERQINIAKSTMSRKGKIIGLVRLGLIRGGNSGGKSLNFLLSKLPPCLLQTLQAPHYESQLGGSTPNLLLLTDTWWLCGQLKQKSPLWWTRNLAKLFNWWGKII